MAEPITVTDAENQMRIEHSDEDALIERPNIMAFIWALHFTNGKHYTWIPVLEAQIASDKLAHNREMKDLKKALRSIESKLDSIELAFRER